MGLRHRVVAAFVKRVTSQNSSDCHYKTFSRSVFLNCFQCVCRAQKIDKRKFQENKQQEIKEAKKELNEKYAEEMTKLEDSLSELKKKQEDELKNYFIDFEKNYPTDIKPSNELIEKQRQLDYYIKTEE